MTATRVALALVAIMTLPTLVPMPAAAEHGPPLVPDEQVPGQAREPLYGAYNTAINTFRRTVGITPSIFHEDFEGPESLEERGWREEIVATGRNAVPIWTVEGVNETKRAQGERTAFVASGEQAASVAGPDGAYDPFRRSRLVSPTIDLRYVLGVGGEAGGPYAQPTLRDVIDESTRVAERRSGSPVMGDLGSVFADPRTSPAERGLVDEHAGAGLVNLTFYHTWDLAPGDHAWLDIRWKEDDGSWSSWLPLEGDAVFETEVDYATFYKASAFCDIDRERRGGLSQQTFNSLSTAGRYCRGENFDLFRALATYYGTVDPIGFANFFAFLDSDGRIGPDFADRFTGTGFPLSLSQILEALLDGQAMPPVYYNDQVDHEPGEEPTRVWSGSSKDIITNAYTIRKSHFTLNRFIGKEVQVAFHFSAGPAAQGEFGWYVDEVKVTAAVPDRDPAVNGLLVPESMDVLAAGTRLRPVALVANNGRMPTAGLNVTFTITSTDTGRTLLSDRVPVPWIDGVTKIGVGSNKLTEPLPAGGYILTVNVTAPAVAGGLPQIDAHPRNNQQTVAFAVRSVLDLAVDVSVPPEAAMTDIDEEKELVVRVTNRGNYNTTGTLNVTIHRVNVTNGEVSDPLAVLTSETLLATEFPFGRDLTVFGAEENYATRRVKWTGEEPGIYVVRARFTETTGAVFDAVPRAVFVRMTPSSLLGPFEFPYNALTPPVSDLEPLRPEQLGFKSWGYYGETNVATGNGYNFCGDQFSSTEPNEGTVVHHAPLCDLALTVGGLGSAKGQWSWIATHDDYIYRQQPGHGTNIFDEGILERIETLSKASVPAGQRLYVTFRHHGLFSWLADETLNQAEPNSFRGQFRILLNGTRPDLPQRYDIAGRPVDPDDLLVYSKNFTEDARWDRVVLDVTQILKHIPAAESRTFKFQWVIQSTPANVVPDWRIGSQTRSEGSGSDTSECEGLGRSANACSLLDPVKRWALDELTIVAANAGTDPLTGYRTVIFRNGAERYASAGDFTNCKANLEPSDAGSGTATRKEGQHRGDPDALTSANANPNDPNQNVGEVKCRQWELYKSRTYPALWYLEHASGKGVPTATADDTWWLRWGNHEGKNTDDHNDPSYLRGIYTVLETPDFTLTGSQQPALVFDHWHEFIGITYDRVHPSDRSRVVNYSIEGGNVWITGRDKDGNVVVHELLKPSPASASQYTLPVWSESWTDSGRAGFRGVPEWPTNYSKVTREPVVFARNSGGGPTPEWTSAKFDLSRYAGSEFADVTYTVQFHAFMTAPLNSLNQPTSKGWRIDNVEVRETHLANDVSLASIESPPSLVGPGVPQNVVIRVRNDGIFAQKGVGVEYRILKDGEVVFKGQQTRVPYGSESDAIPGLRNEDRPDKNVTFPFSVPWTPPKGEEGVYVLEARVNLSDAVEPFVDENPTNDVLRRTIQVKEVHDVSIADPAAMADELVVTPTIGPVGEPRSFTFVVRNNGTVPERFLGQQEDLFRLQVDVVAEDGRSVLTAPLKQNLREIMPGEQVVVEFQNAWQPTRSGVYKILAEVTYPSTDLDNDPMTPDKPADEVVTDNRRIIKHLVFDVVVPAPGRNLSTEFQPDDLALWGHNASRYAGSDGWSFPPEGEYAPGLDSTLTLDRILNLRSVRNAFLRVNQSFDFEDTYDGARVELSLDGGRTWKPVPPRLTGGWKPMSTASPFVGDPDATEHAFTGQGQGMWEFNLGALPELRTTAVLLEDDFENNGLPQLRLNLTDGVPQAPSTPTPRGYRFEFEPIVQGRDTNEIVVKIRAVEGLGKNISNVSKAEVVVNGIPVAMVREWPAGSAKSREVVFKVVLPTDLWNAADRALYASRKPMLANESIVQFRAFGFERHPTTDVEIATAEAVPFLSPLYEYTAGRSFSALPAGRETSFKVAPPEGKKILWSDKSAVLCSEGHSGVQSATTLLRRNCIDIMPKGTTATTKYLETTLDLRTAGENGYIRLDVTDWATVPKTFRWIQSSPVPVEVEQTIRVAFRGSNGGEVVKSPISVGGDRYWNWTERRILVQGEEFARLRGSIVTVSLEHHVTATVGDTAADRIGAQKDNDNRVSLRNTDEYSPNFGWGVARVRLEAAGENLPTVLKVLDPDALAHAREAAGEQHGRWTFGARTTRLQHGQPPVEVHYTDFRDLFQLTNEPLSRGFWRQASSWEWERANNFGPGGAPTNYGFDGALNRFWEANASRLPHETSGGDARLIFPLDLKPAVGRAWLTFNTQYNFHIATFADVTAGTSGGRIEVSVDDGLTWQVLTPISPIPDEAPITEHPLQTRADGTPKLSRTSVRAAYGDLFWQPSLGVGTANPFVPDNLVSAGRAHEYGDVPRDDRGDILPLPNGDPGPAPVKAFARSTPGTTLTTMETYAKYDFSNGKHAVLDWVPVAVDMTPYAGKDVLVAFHAFFSTGRVAAGGEEHNFAKHRDFWRVDDVKVSADIFRGDDVRLRIRATTDNTVSGTGLDVRDVQLLTQKHLLNLGVRVLEPSATDNLRVGENPIAIEVSNKGVLPASGVRLDVWVNATGPGAPEAVHYGAPLGRFAGCNGQPIPPDNTLAAETTVEVCGLLNGDELALSGALDAEYTIEVLVSHAEFDREILVGDNHITEKRSGDRVIANDQIVVDRLVLRPSIVDRDAPRDVVVTATVRLHGFDRADVADAKLRILGDPANPIELGLGQAQSFITRFTAPDETRDLVWVIPKDDVARLREGVLQAEVNVSTAHQSGPLPSIRTAPLYTARDIVASAGFFHVEDVRGAGLMIAANPDSGESTAPNDQSTFSLEQCPADPIREARVWCSYNKPWNESKSSPDPSVSQCREAWCNWDITSVIDTSGMAAESIPPSVKTRGAVFNLDGFQNVPHCTNAQRPQCRTEPRSVSLESPPIDVRNMIGEGKDPRMLLTFLQRHDFGNEGGYARVLAAAWDPGDRSSGVEQRPIPLTDGSANEWVELARFDGASKGYGDLDFEALALDVAGALEANNTRDVDFDYVKIRFVLYLPINARFTGWQVDDIMIGPFGGTLGPQQAFPLNDDTDKTYKFFLRNGGAFSDIYNVTLRRADGSRIVVPEGWNVTVIDEDGAILDQLGTEPAPTDKCARVEGARRDSVELGAGDERLVRLKICIPVSSGTPGRAGIAPIQLTAFSQNIAGIMSGTAMDLDYSYLNRPNVRVLAVRPGLDLPVDQPRQIVVEASNTGTTSACDAKIRVLDVVAGEPPVTLYGPGGAEPTVGSCSRRPDGQLDGGLPPGEARQFRYIWTPRHVGWHNLTAVADPDNIISELVESDNLRAEPVLVKLPSFPDLVVRVDVSEDEPNIGDVVNVSISVRNVGGISAQSVNMTAKIGVTDLLGRGPLAENLIQKIAPGETVWINKTWRAVFPGKALLYVHGLPRDGVLERVETQGNNLVVKPLFVRSQGLDVAAKVVGVTAAPGEAKEVGFLISNNGDTPDSYSLEIEAPRGVRAGIFHEGRKVTSIALDNHTAANLTVLLDLPLKLAAEDYVLGLKAVSDNTTQTRVAQFTLSVRASYGLTLEGAQALTAPGRVEIPISVTNTGNARDPIAIEAANAPPGWKSVLHEDVVEPYGRLTTKLVLDIPTTTPRGIYEVLARVRDHAGTEATAIVGVTIQDFEAAVPKFEVSETLVRPESLVSTTVRLANEGNVRAETRIAAKAPEGWTVRLERPVLVLEPGERATVGVEVLVPPDAAFATRAVEIVSTTGSTTRVDTLNVKVGASDLHILELDYAPRVGILPGKEVNFTAVVRNDGTVDADAVGVAFYVDDVLVGYETVDALPAGGEKSVSFRWSAIGGEHVLLAILDAGDEVRETDEANNARLEVVRVGLGGGLLAAAERAVPGPAAFAALAAIAIAAFAVARQRKTR